MAFNNVRSFFLAPGASVRVWVAWPPNDRIGLSSMPGQIPNRELANGYNAYCPTPRSTRWAATKPGLFVPPTWKSRRT